MPIKALKLYMKEWTIKARLTKKVPIKKCKERQGSIMPLEFIDEEGTQISGLACGEIVESLNQTLQENKVYLISNGTVKIAAKKFTSIKNDLSILLDNNSKVEDAVDDNKIEYKGFNFIQIKTIGVLTEGAIIDVLGGIQSTGPKQTISLKKSGIEILPSPEKTYKRVISLCDESKASIEATLWRDLAEKEIFKGTVVALKRMKITSFKGKQLSSTKETEIVIDPPDPRVKEIKKM